MNINWNPFNLNETTISKKRKSQIKQPSYTWSSNGNNTVPDWNSYSIRDLYYNDSDVKSAIDAKINFILNPGHNLEGDKTPVKRMNKILDRSRTHRLLREIYLNLKVYNNAFVEIEWKNNKPYQMYLLDTETMSIDETSHGVVKGYKQKPVNSKSGEEVTFQPDEVWHISYPDLETKSWSRPDLKSLKQTVATKNAVENFINWLASTNQFRNIIKTEEATDDDIDKLMSDYLATQDDPNLPFIIDGDFEVEVMRSFEEASSFIDIMSYFRHKIFMLLQVPPIVVGLTDNTNRSNSEMEYRIFQVNNNYDRDIFKEEFNKELVPKLGMKNVRWTWESPDKRTEKDDIEIAEKLSGMGMKSKKLTEFLRNTIPDLPDGQLFDDKQNTSTDTDSISDDMTQKKTGTDAETREEQLVGKKFGDYPYEMN